MSSKGIIDAELILKVSQTSLRHAPRNILTTHQMREKQIGKMIQKKKLQEKKESKELVKVGRLSSYPYLPLGAAACQVTLCEIKGICLLLSTAHERRRKIGRASCRERVF